MHANRFSSLSLLFFLGKWLLLAFIIAVLAGTASAFFFSHCSGPRQRVKLTSGLSGSCRWPVCRRLDLPALRHPRGGRQ